jgi:hypothetical protein
MMTVTTVDIDCPRCDDKITCSVEATPRAPKPGHPEADTLNLDLRVVDLANRFAEHYEAAGHTTPANPSQQGQP